MINSHYLFRIKLLSVFIGYSLVKTMEDHHISDITIVSADYLGFGDESIHTMDFSGFHDEPIDFQPTLYSSMTMSALNAQLVNVTALNSQLEVISESEDSLNSQLEDSHLADTFIFDESSIDSSMSDSIASMVMLDVETSSFFVEEDPGGPTFFNN